MHHVYNVMCVRYLTVCPPAAEVTCDEEEETATFRFKTALAAGTATLVIEYEGTLNDKMKGFYRTKYCLPSAPDKELYAAVTQFEVCPVFNHSSNDNRIIVAWLYNLW